MKLRILKSGLILMMAPLLLSSSLGLAKKPKAQVTTTMDQMLLLLDMSRSYNQKAKIFLDDQECQCVCDDSQWTCLDTECGMQEEACMNDEFSKESSYDFVS